MTTIAEMLEEMNAEHAAMWAVARADVNRNKGEVFADEQAAVAHGVAAYGQGAFRIWHAVAGFAVSKYVYRGTARFAY